MGIDFGGGSTIVKTAGITLNTLVFNAAGQGCAATNATPGYFGAKNGGTTYYSGASGWEINSADWQSGLNTTNGVFTCPVAGLYAMGYNGIHNGGGNIPTGLNTYGYAGFGRNGALSYFVHWNMSPGGSSWLNGGQSVLFQCFAGDTLALWVNHAPSPVGPNSVSSNYGLYPNEHHAVWCKLVG
jgi:hypothetical protein